MAFIEVPDVWSVVMRFTATGLRPKTMGFHVQDGLFDDSTTRASVIAAEVDAWADAHLAASYGAGLALTNIQVRSLSSQNGTVYDYAADTPGENAGAGMPGNVAFAISFRTGRAGKSYRGRVYHPWLSESEVTGNSLSQTRADALVAAWETLDASLALLDCYIGVVSLRSNKQWREQGIITRVTSYIWTDLNVDTQRRRVRPL